MTKRYQPQALLGEQGGVQTFAGRDALNGLPVRMYTFMGEPTAKVGELGSPYLPPVLSSHFVGGAGEVIVAFSPEFQPIRGAVAPNQVEALLRQTAAALDDAARAGVVHGDLSPERVLFDREAGAGGRFLLEGYGVPWRVKPSEFSPPERIGGASFAGDLFSWAMTVRHLSGPLSSELRDLLSRCLDADPKSRPQAREVRAALDAYPFGARSPQPGLGGQSARDVSAFDHFSADPDDGDAPDDFKGKLTLIPHPDPVPEPNLLPPETSRQHLRVQPALPEKPQAAPRQTTPPETAKSAGTVRTLPQEAQTGQQTEPGLPADSLRRTDQTSAYNERRARYNAEHGPARPDPVPKADTSPARSVPATVSPAPGATGAPDDEAFSFADDIVDDIDDRAPDPTLSRGGRRVLLLTLLGIAVLVLIALQIINA